MEKEKIDEWMKSLSEVLDASSNVSQELMDGIRSGKHLVPVELLFPIIKKFGKRTTCMSQELDDKGKNIPKTLKTWSRNSFFYSCERCQNFLAELQRANKDPNIVFTGDYDGDTRYAYSYRKVEVENYELTGEKVEYTLTVYPSGYCIFNDNTKFKLATVQDFFTYFVPVWKKRITEIEGCESEMELVTQIQKLLSERVN